MYLQQVLGFVQLPLGLGCTPLWGEHMSQGDSSPGAGLLVGMDRIAEGNLKFKFIRFILIKQLRYIMTTGYVMLLMCVSYCLNLITTVRDQK